MFVRRRSVAVLGATAAIAGLAAVLVSAAPAAAPAKPGVFNGNWVGVEFPGDGSTDVMTIGDSTFGGKRIWRLRETNASGYCSPGGGPFAARGTATAHGHTLTVTVTFATVRSGYGQTASPYPEIVQLDRLVQAAEAFRSDTLGTSRRVS